MSVLGLLAGLLLPAFCFSPPVFADTLESFESGEVALFSFPGEDEEPARWCLDSVVTHNGSRYALKLFGNTWKVESVGPLRLDSGDVWEVWAYVESVADVQGFGLVSAGETLLYAFSGSRRVDPARFVTVYQGAFPLRTWNCYRLPVGEEWLSRFGHLATVDGMVFFNDRDSSGQGVIYFDDVVNITADLPVAPVVTAWYEIEGEERNLDGSWTVTVHFFSRVDDPDSKGHFYRWEFGDGGVSFDSCPVHTYVVRDAHRYTVLLEVSDESGLRGRDSCWVPVEPGRSTFPLRLSFVGDVMLARRYEPLIETLGVEGVFALIQPYLAGADVRVANLECPLTDRGTRHPTKPIVFRGKPEYVEGLRYAGFDVVSLANNHIIDYGLEGLQQTQRVLDSAGIRYGGAGANSYEASLPVFVVKSGVNIGFLAYSDRTGQYDNYQPYLNAGYNKPGFALLDSFRVFADIRRVREVSDRVVVQLHSGEEYQPVPGDDEWYQPAAVVPGQNQVALRRRLIDAGADLVVCHHPHILQGFEVYQGRLIAHSLGNFAFDQEYPETYPSVILQGLLDGRGFYDFSLVPVYIDDYIPRRATGELGVYILKYLARRSRELNTYLLVDPESAFGQVVLDSSGLHRRVTSRTVRTLLVADSVYRTSPPLRIGDTGSISRVVGVVPDGEWQCRLGRELVWFGNMEDEGATLWNLNQSGELYDSLSKRGRRSLGQERPAGSGTIITNFEERMVLPADGQRLTVYGWLRCENGRNAGIVFNCYNSRIGGSRVGACSLGMVSGSCGWRYFFASCSLPANAGFFDLWLVSSGPDSGTGRVWFDDVGVIQWSDWQELDAPLTVAEPNDYWWLQVRTTAGLDSAVVNYQETDYRLSGAMREGGAVAVRLPVVQVQPSVVKGRAVINLFLPGPAGWRLQVYDCVGRLVREWRLVNRSGGQKVFWDLRDGSGGSVAAGTYFFRLEGRGGSAVTRVVVLRD